MKSFLMTCLVGILLVAPTSVLAEKETPSAGQNVTNLTEAIQYSNDNYAKKPIFKGRKLRHYIICLPERTAIERPHHPYRRLYPSAGRIRHGRDRRDRV